MGLKARFDAPATEGYYHMEAASARERVREIPTEDVRHALISIEDVTLGYRGQAVLKQVSLAVYEGEFLGIVGPNGSGKSTLLKAILGLLPPMAGRVERFGCRASDAGQARPYYGYVPQRDTVDPTFPLSVRQIVGMGRYGRLGLFRRPGKEDWAVVDCVLERVGIADLASRGYGELSGGQRQRALIARALAAAPDLLVLDEPTNGMDLESEHALLEMIRELHEATGVTVLMVTHLLNNVANYAERIAIIAGERLAVGDREMMLSEAQLSSLYRMPVRVERVDGRTVIIPGDGGRR